ncbi:prolyl oligopeptidase [Allocatelliglobosispora scoriae]|uniref:prolyl oligopeptidase n=1 Tax=Allocatelliglobosispora scoriae TaxID=643052 RepID=A0A841BP75_9ACTN|nr:prolyl oligopeptidase family serine peptidase [Allocatelliglobosispora scoriae]MBB5868631.1 prolyl oligopeptidase [Allocatelliglobosispora scoriae]
MTAYPDAPRLDIVDMIHGQPVADPYRWLEDAASPQAKEWSAAQDELLTAHRRSWSSRTPFRDSVARLLTAGTVSSPTRVAGQLFYSRRDAGQEHASFWVIRADSTRRLLIDPMAIDPTGHTVLDFATPSPDGRYVAYGISANGSEESVIHVLDVESGALVEAPIDRAWFTNLAWVPGEEAFYYVRHLPRDSMPDGTGYLYRRVYLHRLGDHPDTDRLVAGEDAGPGRYFTVGISTDRRWLTVTDKQGTDPRNNIHVADLDAVDPELELVQKEADDAFTHVEIHDGRAYVLTNRSAPRWRLCVTTPDRLGYADWRDLIAEDPDAVLADYAILDAPELPRKLLLVARTRHAVSELTVHDLGTGELLETIALPGVGTVGQLRTGPGQHSEAWFTYTDFATRPTVYRFDGRDRSVDVWARPPGAPVPDGITAKQVTYTSGDGTPVRMFLITNRDTPPGPHPTVLYGYGGFNVGWSPHFSSEIAAWVAAGGVWAVANLRGGGEEGEQWHRAGMLANKQNVFDDFRAAAQWLADQGITTPDRLCVAGGSNGGLLVGAAVTQFPELFNAAICGAPLLDMIRYEKFGLGMTWSGEYGTVSDAEQFGWLLAYSPYHRVVEETEYPHVLFTVFDGDSRVDPLHARKMAAALQHATSSRRPVLIRREADVGHAERAVTNSIELVADELGFAANATGLDLDEED